MDRQRNWGKGIGVGLAVVLLVIYFFEALYSSGATPESRLTRGDVLLWALSPGDAETPNPLTTLFKNLSNVSELWNRLPFLLVALFTWSLAGMLGTVAMTPLVPRQYLTRGEWWLLGAGIGMAGLSLIVQALGLLGLLQRELLLIIGGLSIATWGSRRVWKAREATSFEKLPPAGRWLRTWTIGAGLAVLLLATLSAMLPTPDFDAHAYHLLGPKEWFLDGRIHFLPHNVYTSFPFLIEMFPLVGMVLFGDWFTGALAGQTILAGFGFASVIAVGMVARRLFGSEAGWLAGMVYATAPWTYRLTSIPYVEGGMIFYLALGMLVALRFREQPVIGGWLTGLAAGAAFGCKYTALFMVVVPLFGGGIVLASRRVRWVIYFALGFSAVAGIWLARNVAWTGNPVYPLLYSWFGGVAWDESLADRFTRGHQSTTFSLWGMLGFVRDIATRSDWQSGLVFAFVPLAFLKPTRRAALGLGLGIIYTFFVFYFATHRLDRFFLTIQPLAAMLAGAGLAALSGPVGRWVRGPLVMVCVIFNVVLCSTPLGGMNLYSAPLQAARKVALDAVAPSLSALEESGQVQKDKTVLFVGLAAVYESKSRVRYNTVFNHNRLEQIIGRLMADGKTEADDIRAALAKQGIDYIFVDWTWVDRYRMPGNYGFTDFIQRILFEDLTREKVLDHIPIVGEPAWQLFRVRDGGTD